MEISDRKWEVLLEEGGSGFTERLAVPGGWVYRSVFYPIREEGNVALSMCFGPDSSLTNSEVNDGQI